MSDILNHSTDNVTRPASSINPKESPPVLDAELVQDTIEKYFTTHEDPVIRTAFNKGKIFTLKDDFDFIRFFKSILGIFEERMSDGDLTQHENQQIKQIFNTIDSCLNVLKTINVKEENSEILPLLINYCMSSFSRYNTSYVKSREIQK